MYQQYDMISRMLDEDTTLEDRTTLSTDRIAELLEVDFAPVHKPQLRLFLWSTRIHPMQSVSLLSVNELMAIIWDNVRSELDARATSQQE